MADPKISIRDVSYAYDGESALRDVTLDVPANSVTVVFGPAGGGKSTLLRLFYRLNDLVDGNHMSGQVLLDGKDIYAPGTDVTDLRRRVGMVFAPPLPLPLNLPLSLPLNLPLTLNPMWWRGRLHFTSDKDGTVNLWSVDRDGRDLRQHTRHADWPVRQPALEDGRIVYHGEDRQLETAIEHLLAKIAEEPISPLEGRTSFPIQEPGKDVE